MKQLKALRTQQHINITTDEQKQDLLDELIARQLVVEDAIESGLTQTEEFKIISRICFPTTVSDKCLKQLL